MNPRKRVSGEHELLNLLYEHPHRVVPIPFGNIFVLHQNLELLCGQQVRRRDHQPNGRSTDEEFDLKLCDEFLKKRKKIKIKSGMNNCTSLIQHSSVEHIPANLRNFCVSGLRLGPLTELESSSVELRGSNISLSST